MPAQFNGFGKDSLKFLKALGFHQSREWFQENRDLYLQEIREPMGDLVEALTEKFAAAKIPLRGDRKTSLYRVNRDVRFSKNKDPYNTHASLMLTRTGTKKDNGFVYLHYSNEQAFIASGFYGLEPKELRAFRELILREPGAYSKIHEDMLKHGYRLEDETALKRNPRGFEHVEDELLARFIRQKNHAYMEDLPAKVYQTPQIIDHMFEMGKRAMPLLEFGWRAVDSVRED